MPSIPWGNIQLPVVMIAEKCADHVKERNNIPVRRPGCKKSKTDRLKGSRACRCGYGFEDECRCKKSSKSSSFSSSSTSSD